ncbi:hypothetical protein Tel_15345 [Candidatus Tenderia electrophaga]|jgi:hypothetical protein|uniref:DUF3581 domain-containing protein n=1 Tax=Candidatus Tenderia electrophaga TaxID=1748243 RepID=A0A0S2TGY7_9GAMM|nr:hypothetical protein Tel_15345 [Candidatus Tenderia electrophaga]
MRLEDYFSRRDNRILVSRRQASSFAKKIAGDFNPIHDEDAKRFCVPGDLLFALGLHHYGLSQRMCINFGGMVSDSVPLLFSESDGDDISICDENGKEYLNISRSGQRSGDEALISELTQRYVEFSGQTFPHILVPLMKEKQLMINTDRPLVIYERMVINLDDLDIRGPRLELSSSNLDVEGKRGNVSVRFVVKDAERTVGHGEKHIVLSGLREYDQAKIDQLVTDYNARKESYQG